MRVRVQPTPEELDILGAWICRRGINSPLIPEEGCIVEFYRTAPYPGETYLHHGSHVTRASWIRSTGQVIRVWFNYNSVKLADHLDPKTGFPKKRTKKSPRDLEEQAVVENILSEYRRLRK